MEGSNKNSRDWFGYLMNFVAVCLGIVITFAGQGLYEENYQVFADFFSAFLFYGKPD